jgi:beta-N-acetylhexosaminidase
MQKARLPKNFVTAMALLLALPAFVAAVPPAQAEKAAKVAAKSAETLKAGETAQTKPKTPRLLLSRSEILQSDPERLARAGRHIIVGYHSLSEIKQLLEKKAIGGIFITDHNVRGRNAASTKSTIDALQATRKEQGLPPLIIAADQEGGAVSRLSPPLKRQPSLAQAVAKAANDEERKKIVEDYARVQAEELKRIGVTLNFAPVVDLKLNPKNRNDGETQLRHRAIDADPYLVSKVAGWYCDVLAASNIMCTLKHFPGLGRVTRDTHVATAEISTTEGTLELNDWVPFRRVMAKPNAVTMLGHVRVGVLDKSTPASFSAPVINTLIRGTWQHDGLLVTDDFSMGAVTHSKEGVGGAAVKSLNAGTDFVLLSYTEKDFDAMMSAILAADSAGELDAKTLDASQARIERILSAPIAPDAVK